MFIYIFSAFVYVFFVYGLIEFVRHVYLDYLPALSKQERKIVVVLENVEGLEYTIRTLRKEFNHIIVIVKENIEEAEKIAERLSNDILVEVKSLESLSGVKKSE